MQLHPVWPLSYAEALLIFSREKKPKAPLPDNMVQLGLLGTSQSNARDFQGYVMITSTEESERCFDFVRDVKKVKDVLIWHLKLLFMSSSVLAIVFLEKVFTFWWFLLLFFYRNKQIKTRIWKYLVFMTVAVFLIFFGFLTFLTYLPK